MFPKARRLTPILTAFCLLLHVASAEPPTKKEIASTAAWFKSLPWPDLRGKPYVEIVPTAPWRMDNDYPRVRGFLLAEDEQSLTFFHTSIQSKTQTDRGSDSEIGWPCAVEQFSKSWPTEYGEIKNTYRVIPLAEAVKEVLEALRRPPPEHGRGSRYKFSERTAVFVFARCCARHGRADLAEQLDAELMTIDTRQWPLRARFEEKGELSFRVDVERDIAHSLMWRAVVDFGHPAITRPELLTRFEQIVRDFPASEHREWAKEIVATLRKMIAEDKAHARKVKPFEKMTDLEKVHELIFRLRDQNGYQEGQPERCNIFYYDGRPGRPESPAQQLVKLGHVAVPALIEALHDERFSRSVGHHRDFYFSHNVFTIGACAQDILTRMAGRYIWPPYSPNRTVEDMTKAAETWWRGVQEKGDKQVLIEGVRSGETFTAEQARRLAALDPAAAVEAIVAGIDASKHDGNHVAGVEVIAQIKSDDATAALRRVMNTCDSLRGRVSAATELLRRGQPDAVRAMIGEWNQWKPSRAEQWRFSAAGVEELIGFLGACDDASAIRALGERYAAQTAEVRSGIVEVLLGSRFSIESEKKTPLSAEVEALTEEVLVSALHDRDLCSRSVSTGDVSYINIRICDVVASGLAERWPQRYQFQWRPGRSERDIEVIRAQNVWRTARGREVLPLPMPPAPAVAVQQPNAVALLQWTRGEPLPGVPIAEGRPLTADAVIETIAKIHRELPKNLDGFDFTAERAGDRPGFLITIDWALPPGRNPSGTRAADRVRNCQARISLGEEELCSILSAEMTESRAQSSGYESEKRALTKALEGDASKAISIMFVSRRMQD